jgi:hypothetical protein
MATPLSAGLNPGEVFCYQIDRTFLPKQSFSVVAMDRVRRSIKNRIASKLWPESGFASFI